MGYELWMVVEKGIDFRIHFQQDIRKLVNDSKELNNLISNYSSNKNISLKRSINEKIKSLRNFCRLFWQHYCSYISENILLGQTVAKIEEVISCDLRRCDETFGKVIDLYNAMVNDKLIGT